MVEEKKIIPLTYDFMFKALFGNEKNISILTKLISDYFEINYISIEGRVKILNSELIKKDKLDKKKSVDVIVELNENEILNIEMNANKGKEPLAIIERNTSYICKIYSEQYKTGDDYTKTKKCIQINFNNFRMEGEKEGNSIYKLINENNNKSLTKNLEIHHINMEYISKMCYNEFTRKELMNWVKLIKSKSLEEIKRRSEFMGEKMSKEFTNEVERLSSDEHIIGLYDGELEEQMMRDTIRNYNKELGYKEGKEEGRKEGRKEGIKEGLEEGIKEGIKEGVEKNKKQTVINMIKENIDIKVISNVTGLSETEINNIKNNN